MSGGGAGVAGGEVQGTTPRDVRLLHLILASMGVTSYQDRVPLQLMDFAYRYTRGVLQDALQYSDHAHSGSGGSSATSAASNIPLTINDVRLAVAARVNYQFKPVPPKELMLDLAQERNKRPLPGVIQQYGLRLPPEKYCLTSKEWNFEDEADEIMTEMVPVESDEVPGYANGETNDEMNEISANDVEMQDAL